MTHKQGLEKLIELLENYGVRKHTCINGWGYSQIERDIVSLFIPEPEPQEQRPFDKLKELWEGYKKTDCSCLEEYLVGKGRAYNSNTIHQWIAEHCGFATTAEVRRAIQKLKNF